MQEVSTAKVATVFKALCDESRVQIIRQLQGGELCGCELMARLAMAQSALSYHMKILCSSGIVESRNIGKWTHYKISQEGSEYAVELLTTLTKVEK